MESLWRVRGSLGNASLDTRPFFIRSHSPVSRSILEMIYLELFTICFPVSSHSSSLFPFAPAVYIPVYTRRKIQLMFFLRMKIRFLSSRLWKVELLNRSSRIIRVLFRVLKSRQIKYPWNRDSAFIKKIREIVIYSLIISCCFCNLDWYYLCLKKSSFRCQIK